VNVPEIFIVPEISRNVSKSLEVIRPIILFKFVDFPESRAKNKLLFLNIMHEVKTQRSGKLLVKTMLIIYFHMVVIKTYKVKKNSLTISGKIGINSQP